MSWLIWAGLVLPVQAEETDDVEPTDHRYVAASSLYLRDAPDGAPVRSLPINTRVGLLDQRGSYARVRTSDGLVGWVARDYLVPTETSLASLLWIANLTEKPEERLLYAERAAALEPGDPGVLLYLAAAQRSAGRKTAAKGTLDRITGGYAIALAGAWDPAKRGVLRLELGLAGYDIDEAKTEVPDPVGFAALVDGLQVWVLPATGKAVRGPVQGVELLRGRDCGFHQYALLAEVGLDKGDMPVAWTLADVPPPSWMDASVAKGFDAPVVAQRDIDSAPPIEVVEITECGMTIRSGDDEIASRSQCCED